MRLTLDEILGFFVEFERSIKQIAPNPVFTSYPRSVNSIVNLFSQHANCIFTIEQTDFSDRSELRDGEYSYICNLDKSTLVSIALNFGSHAKIILNSQKNYDGSPVLNYCHVRYFTLKEAFHIIIRDEFMRWGLSHPDINKPAVLSSTVEEIIFLPFSVWDFGNPKYPEAVTIENAAELLALLMLYPFDDLMSDRSRYLSRTRSDDVNVPQVIVSSTRAYAEAYKVPQRYVDLLFRMEKLPTLYARYIELRDGQATDRPWPPTPGIKPPPF